MLQICCKCEIHIKQCFAAPKSKEYTKLVAIAHQKVPSRQEQAAKKLNALLLVPKQDKNRYTAVYSDTMSMGNHKTSCKQCVSTKYEKLHTNLSHAPVYRMQKSQKHSFWYQNFSNLLQVRITYNARCLFEHKNHNSSCKQCIFTTSMYFSPLSSVAKISTALFLVPKRTKTVTELFFSPSMNLFQKVQCSHVPIATSQKH